MHALILKFKYFLKKLKFWQDKLPNNLVLNLHAPKLTGELMFKFNDDEPIHAAVIYDYGDVTLTLSQNKHDLSVTPMITFTSDTGETFTLYIKNNF